jgi:uncharacterized membrane protein
MELTSPYTIIRFILAVLISLYLAAHGIKKKSLSTSGALAAISVGFTTFAISYKLGFILIFFYYVSSKLTKLKEDIKSRLEDGYLQGGQRDFVQVYSCSILATMVAVLLELYSDPDIDISFKPSGDLIRFGEYTIDRQIFGSMLACMYMAHYATAAGDTWASEVGILAKSQPRLVTSLFLRKVPPGTNGGISLLGTAASASGGAFIGFIYYLYDAVFLSNRHDRYMIILFGTVCGVLGSLLDSLLGATLQVTYYSKSRKCIVKNLTNTKKEDDITVICGNNILSNEAVNFVSILMTMILAVWLGPLFF